MNDLSNIELADVVSKYLDRILSEVTIRPVATPSLMCGFIKAFLNITRDAGHDRLVHFEGNFPRETPYYAIDLEDVADCLHRITPELGRLDSSEVGDALVDAIDQLAPTAESIATHSGHVGDRYTMFIAEPELLAKGVMTTTEHGKWASMVRPERQRAQQRG